jgi:hypothetical protein
MYRTGDLARYRRDGTIECLGRVDHQVKVRGFRIELGEIEAALEAYPGTKQVVVVVREDAKDDRRLIAYWSGKVAARSTTSDFRRFLEGRSPAYMIPSAFVYLDAFPLTPNGKVDRHRLPVPNSDRPMVESDYIAPGNETERTIADIWQQVLKVTKVGTHDNFFDLGGNSLLIVQVHARLRTALGRDIPLIEFFQKPTVSSLAALLSDNSDEGDTFERIKARAKKQKQAFHEAS